MGTQSDQWTRVADKDHEGHSGFTIGGIARDVNPWLTSTQPNIILLMAGTNDIAWWTAENANQIGARHNALIDQLRVARPTAWIFVASIPPQSSALVKPNNIDRSLLVQQFNTVIRQNVDARVALGQNVRFVDVNSVLTTADLYDGIHPTEVAHAKIAQKFLDVIRSTLALSTLPPPPAPTPTPVTAPAPTPTSLDLSGIEAVVQKTLTTTKEKYFLANGRVESGTNRTTSESQSYGMLIAILANDRSTFDNVWNWTRSTLQTRPTDKLFSWVWENGAIPDKNPATDADQDIAYALYLAYKKWGDVAYLNQAKEIVRDIWNVETKEVAGTRYVGAGNWAVLYYPGIVVNPSYLAPYQYRAFATFDTEHAWMSLVDSSYKVLAMCTGALGLAMDWCSLDAQGNLIADFKLNGTESSRYSYDALRVPYRVAMDYLWYGESRGLAHLNKNTVFARDWVAKGEIFAVYTQAGVSEVPYGSLASYGAMLTGVSLVNKTMGSEIFDRKIASVDAFKYAGFYEVAWVLLGLDLYKEKLRRD